MRKLLVIICAAFLAQVAMAVSPQELKSARCALYQWVDDYEILSRSIGGRGWKGKYLRLFASRQTVVYNDCFPSEYFHVQDANIPVERYVAYLADDKPFEGWIEMRNIHLEEEYLEGGDLHYRIRFDKVVNYAEKDNYRRGRYVYPERVLQMEAKLVYFVHEEEMRAQQITCLNEPQEDAILRQEGDTVKYTYCKKADIERALEEKTEPQTITKIKNCKYDHFISVVSDTIWNVLSVSVLPQLSFPGYRINTNLQTQSPTQFGTGVMFTYSKLLSWRKSHQWYIQTGLRFDYKHFSVTGEYYDAYNDIDTDGGKYLRKVTITNYQDQLSQLDVAIPVGLSYNCKLNKKNGVFVDCGVLFGMNLLTTSAYSFDAKYEGYYAWLFDVTLSQNGIYDFGEFAGQSGKESQSASEIGIKVYLGVGYRYYLSQNMSIDVAIDYQAPLYIHYQTQAEVLQPSMQHIHKSLLLHSIERVRTQDINLKIQFNYYL